MGPTAPLRSSVLYLGCLLIIVGFAAYGAVASDAAKTVGPNACAECHKQEAEAWKGTHHFKTYREMPRNSKANEIADKMGVRRIRQESLCLNCHFTVQQKNNREEPVAGISCESCHGAGQDWIKVHSGFSGKTTLFESKVEEKERWKLADSKGMIRPRSFYLLAKNCYACHVVPQEDLVNKGGHKAGSAFELMSWSQGEVLHNTWYSKGRENVPANAARKRMLYLIGLGVELETALRAIGKATVRKAYAFEMAKRADGARKQLAAAAKAAPNVPEIARIVELSHTAGLKLNNERSLTAAADSISNQITIMTEKYDGSTMSGLDSLIPGPEKFKGTARKPDN
ncbi:cytochrome c family protein [Hyphomicrobium sp.]|uniref:cytochrome c family protein n=1 Tax=Hyphomicrobium sp. TaxID=82 RepID=UPI002E34C06A|nr:cytochrome c family protein [Hyphomicrobium sp.]HEX2841688.1 cytochrome c family protein [Hyphomicrobium sp.]